MDKKILYQNKLEEIGATKNFNTAMLVGLLGYVGILVGSGITSYLTGADPNQTLLQNTIAYHLLATGYNLSGNVADLVSTIHFLKNSDADELNPDVPDKPTIPQIIKYYVPNILIQNSISLAFAPFGFANGSMKYTAAVNNFKLS